MISNKRKRPLWVVNVDKLEAHIGRALSAPAEETKCNLISVEQALISSPSTRVQPVDAKAQSDDAVESEIPFQDVSKIFTHKYNLEKKIGHGGHAEVFACCEKLTGLPFAVKISRKWQDADKSKWYHNSGRNEAMMLIGLNHPRIVSLRDFLDENGRIYMVTDLAGGGALFELIGKLHEFEIRRIFARFFEGVKYLHDNNIVHRDIKPDNILVMNRALEIKISDFGAAASPNKKGNIYAKNLVGTLSYMAPEVIKQDPYGRPVDIWAAGVSLYLCLSSTYPFDNEPYPTEHPLYSDDIRIRDKIKMGRYELPSPVWDNISGGAKNLIFNMLMVNSKKRYTIEQCLEHPWLTEKSEPLSKDLKESNYEAELGDLDQGEPQRVESIMSE